ncbi:MAG: type II secretion system F family protein [Acidimicrobiales bacterium]
MSPSIAAGLCALGVVILSISARQLRRIGASARIRRELVQPFCSAAQCRLMDGSGAIGLGADVSGVAACPAPASGLGTLTAPVLIRSALAQSGWPGNPDQALRVWLVLTVTFTATAALALGLAAGGATLACAAFAPILGLRRLKAQIPVRLAAQLPMALESTARSLRSGSSLVGAIDDASRSVAWPLAPELARVVEGTRRGQTLAGSLGSLAQRHRCPEVKLAVAALELGDESGGPQARAFDGLAASLRQRLTAAQEVRALSSQARLSALIIGLAPLAFAAFTSLVDPQTRGFLTGTGAGRMILIAGLTLEAAGWLWMRRICRVSR